MTDRRILYIAPSPPYPLTNGQAIRNFHLLRAYAAIGRVRLTFLYRSEVQLEAATALRPFCETLHPVPADEVPSEEPPLWRRRVALVATLNPSIVSACVSARMRQLVDSLAPSVDLVHVAKLWMVPNAEGALRRDRSLRRLVLDLDDVETVVKRRALASYPPDRWQRRLLESYDMLRLWRYQRRALRVFDRVFVCSRHDYERLRQPNVEVIPNGTEIPSCPLPDESDGQTLLSVGTLAWKPNVDGLLLFVRETLPLIQRELPGVRLLVVGSGVPDEVQKLHDGNRICVFSNVPTVEPYYRQATAAVVSLRTGGGTRLRILEAFAFGRPVVSTPVGCEGLGVLDGEHLLVSDDPRRFAESCVTLLREPGLRARLAARSREFVERTYAWGPIENQVKAIVRDLLEQQ